MNQNMIDCEQAERDAGMCGCQEGSSLEILKDVHTMYEEKMATIDRTGGGRKLQLQVEVFRSWVSDLAAQNTLLATAVQELEAATTKLIFERKRHSDVVSALRTKLSSLRHRLARKHSDLRGLIEVLRRLRESDCCANDGIPFFEVTESEIYGSKEWRQRRLAQGEVKRKPKPVKQRNTKYYLVQPQFHRSPSPARMNDLKVLNESLTNDNMAKDREILKLTNDVQQHEQTIMNMRKERPCSKCNSLEVSKRDMGVMCMRCAENECGDWEPSLDYSQIIRHETLQFQERIKDMDTKLKSSSKAVLSLWKTNASLTEELAATRHLCTELIKEGCAINTKSEFKDAVILSMRRKIKQLKAKLAEVSPLSPVTSLEFKNSVSDDGECPRRSASYEAVTIACVRNQPRWNRDGPTPSLPAMSRNHDHDNVISRNRTEREGIVCGDIDTNDLYAGNTDCDVSCNRNIDREVFVRGNTIFANVVCDKSPYEMARGCDCGLNLNESGDHGPSNLV